MRVYIEKIHYTFPQSTEDLTKILGNGLTKREYFAAMAMQGLLASPNKPVSANHEWGSETFVVAKLAVEMSDELLKQLEV